ncbi:MAG: hypothetical protein RLZZ592_361 [Pseudomonadota bacterium]|jgi:flagellar hook-length control protein FliK
MDPSLLSFSQASARAGRPGPAAGEGGTTSGDPNGAAVFSRLLSSSMASGVASGGEAADPDAVSGASDLPSLSRLAGAWSRRLGGGGHEVKKDRASGGADPGSVDESLTAAPDAREIARPEAPLGADEKSLSEPVAGLPQALPAETAPGPQAEAPVDADLLVQAGLVAGGIVARAAVPEAGAEAQGVRRMRSSEAQTSPGSHLATALSCGGDGMSRSVRSSLDRSPPGLPWAAPAAGQGATVSPASWSDRQVRIDPPTSALSSAAESAATAVSEVPRGRGDERPGGAGIVVSRASAPVPERASERRASSDRAEQMASLLASAALMVPRGAAPESVRSEVPVMSPAAVSARAEQQGLSSASRADLFASTTGASAPTERSDRGVEGRAAETSAEAWAGVLAQAGMAGGPIVASGTPSAAFRVETPVGHPDFADEVAAHVVQHAHWTRQGVSEVTLHLNPVEMGPVSVRIAIEGGVASVDFGATQAATRHQLEQSLPALAAALGEDGLSLGHSSVGEVASSSMASDGFLGGAAGSDGWGGSSSDARPRDPGGQNDAPRQGAGRFAVDRPDGLAHPEARVADPMPSPVTSRATSRTGGLDFFA